MPPHPLGGDLPYPIGASASPRLKHISKVVCFPEPGGGGGPSGGLELRGDLGVTAWRGITARQSLPFCFFDFSLPPRPSQDCGTCSGRQHQKPISEYFVEGFPTVT